MKKTLQNTLLAALMTAMAAMTAHAQVPSITSSTLMSFYEGNNAWRATVADLQTAMGAGAGSVTSIDVSGGTTGLTTTGGPVTTAGTITLTGTLDADNGGTGQSSYAVGDILYASSTSALSKLADVATGNALISGGVTTAPAWGKIGLTTHISGTLAVANGGTNLTAVGGAGTILGSTGSANAYLNPTITTTAATIAYTLNGSNLELNIPNADASNRGTVSTGTQTMAGAKTWSNLGTFSAGVTSTSAAGAAAVYATGVAGSTWVTETTTQTLDETDNYVQIGTLSGAVTFNLPACNATRNGWEYRFLKTGSDTNGATIDPNGSETFVDTATTKTLYSQGTRAMCKCRFESSTGTWLFETN